MSPTTDRETQVFVCKITRNVDNSTRYKGLNFCGDLYHCLHPEIFRQIVHYCTIAISNIACVGPWLRFALSVFLVGKVLLIILLVIRLQKLIIKLL